MKAKTRQEKASGCDCIQNRSDYSIEFCGLHKAAPELLEACKKAQLVIAEAINKRKTPLSQNWHDLESVIAKAEGKQ